MPKRSVPPDDGVPSQSSGSLSSKKVRHLGIEQELGDIGLGSDSSFDEAKERLRKGIAYLQAQHPTRDVRQEVFGRYEKPQDEQTFIDQDELAGIFEILEDDPQNEQIDEWMATSLKTLVRRIKRFAERVPMIRKSEKNALYLKIVSAKDTMGESLVRYLGCLAIGGPHGKESWVTLLADHECRKALVVGIIGRVLKEHVFSHLYFGTTQGNVTILDQLERELVERDGFERTKRRGQASRAFDINVAERDSQVDDLTLRICELLSPFWNYKRPYALVESADLSVLVRNIVKEAWVINYTIRNVEGVVYYWPPTFKDEEFEPTRMECINLDTIISSSPYDKEKDASGRDRAKLRKGRENDHEAIVRVVCFPGLVAYRQGGGSLAQKQLQAEKKRGDNAPPDVQLHRRRMGGGADSYTGDEGFRSRVVSKSVVMLQWGKQRLLTKEAGTSAHIDAVRDGKMHKYTENSKGYAELWDLHEEKLKTVGSGS